MTISFRPLLLAGFVLLAVPACANSSSMPVIEGSAAGSPGIDLGPSSRLPVTRIAMAGGHAAQNHAAGGASGQAQLVHGDAADAHSTGTVNSVDAAQRKINLSHHPISSLGWPAMTMDFSVAPSVDLSRIQPGSRVEFSLGKGKGGMYEILSIQPAGPAR